MFRNLLSKVTQQSHLEQPESVVPRHRPVNVPHSPTAPVTSRLHGHFNPFLTSDVYHERILFCSLLFSVMHNLLHWWMLLSNMAEVSYNYFRICASCCQMSELSVQTIFILL